AFPVVQDPADEVPDAALETAHEFGERALVILGHASHEVLVGEAHDLRVAVRGQTRPHLSVDTPAGAPGSELSAKGGARAGSRGRGADWKAPGREAEPPGGAAGGGARWGHERFQRCAQSWETKLSSSKTNGCAVGKLPRVQRYRSALSLSATRRAF